MPTSSWEQWKKTQWFWRRNKQRFKKGAVVHLRRAIDGPEAPLEEWRVWSVRQDGKLLILTQLDPSDPDYPPLALNKPVRKHGPQSGVAKGAYGPVPEDY